jgi:N-acetylneuraminate synthase
MSNYVEIGQYKVGPDYPPFLVCEIGINYAMDDNFLQNTLDMIHLARMAGAHAVKFQKRTPRICVPESEWNKPKETPWGERKYIDYKEDIEFDRPEYDAIDAKCKEEGILWFASVWDEPSLEFMETYNPPCYKVGSANLTDEPLLAKILDTERPIILSTGMSTSEEIFRALYFCEAAVGRLIICHSTSIYPCPKPKLNLRMIATIKDTVKDVVVTGYSGHEIGTSVTPAAVALGASYIERHFTLNRRGWGTDQAASIEHWQFKQMVDQCNEIWAALGTGVKEVYPEELEKMASLRKVAVV